MSTFLLSLISLSLIVGSIACKTSSHSDTNEAQGSSKPKKVLLVFGGFASCGSDNVYTASPLATSGALGSMAKVYQKAVAGMGGQPDRTFRTCYTFEFNNQAILANVDAFNLFVADSGTPKAIKKAAPEPTLDSIISKIAEMKNAEVHVVGHSYGGWTAMKFLDQTVKRYENPSQQPFKIKSFVTLDPISKNECKGKGIIDSVMKHQASGKPLPEDISPEGCLRAPIEFNANLKTMACRVSVWKNYYQEVSGIIASSALGKGLNVPIQNTDIMSIPTERNPAAFTKVTVGGHLAFLTEDPLLDQVSELIAEQVAKPFALQPGCSL